MKARAGKQLKARRRFRAYKLRKEKFKLGKSEINYRHVRDWPTNLTAPNKFSLIDNPEKTIQFINKIEACLNTRKRVFIILKDVTYIDYGAISVLLSVMELFRLNSVRFNGDMPINQEVYKKLNESGFFDELYKANNKKNEYKNGKLNQIFTRTDNKVEAELGLPVMIDATTAIWGEKRLCKGLQRIFLELMHNTNNHAGGLDSQGHERWCYSVNHNTESNKVEFAFVDYGIGIFNSLKLKQKGNKWYGWETKLKQVLKIDVGALTNEILLQQLLDGEIHASVTGSSFRGKGLPGIKEVADKNQVSRLFVISNNAYGDTSNNEYKLLREDFSGTFVYWELCYANENMPWTI